MALFVPFPLWWAMGMGAFIFIVAAVPMAAWLWKARSTVVLPEGFSLWLLFLLWVLLGVAVLWADAPGAVAGGGGTGRLMVFCYRALMYLSFTVVLLYVGNMSERRLPEIRVVRLLAYMFVITVLGGLAGVLAPTFEFRSPLELVLPPGLANNAFLGDLMHPATASTQTFLGFDTPRPIAPYAYSNSWGANYSLYLPFFLLAWLGPSAGWRRRAAAPLILAVSMVPVVQSLNRGLWLGLLVLAAYGTVRAVLSRSAKGFALVLAGAVVAVWIVFATPLGSTIEQRLETPHSNDRRSQLAEESVASMVKGSPLLGFGSTRDVQGSFASIAGGATADCPACGVPPFGTQGHLWLVLFSQGLVGALLFLSFLVFRFLRHVRDRAPIAVIGTGVLLVFFVEIFVYDTLGAPFFTVGVSLALMWRHERESRTETAVGGVR